MALKPPSTVYIKNIGQGHGTTCVQHNQFHTVSAHPHIWTGEDKVNSWGQLRTAETVRETQTQAGNTALLGSPKHNKQEAEGRI